MPRGPSNWIVRVDPMPTDEQIRLARRARTDDRAATTILVRQVAHQVMSLARRARRPWLADDLFAEGMLAATNAIGDFDARISGNVCAFMLWRARSAISNAVTNSDRDGRAESDEEAEEADTAPTAEQQLDLHERVATVRSAIKIAEREIAHGRVAAKILLGIYDARQAASCGRFTAASIRVATSRLRAKLRSRLAESP